MTDAELGTLKRLADELDGLPLDECRFLIYELEDLRHRYAEAVERAIVAIMGRAHAASGTAVFVDPVILRDIFDAAWLASEARKGLEGER